MKLPGHDGIHAIVVLVAGVDHVGITDATVSNPDRDIIVSDGPAVELVRGEDAGFVSGRPSSAVCTD